MNDNSGPTCNDCKFFHLHDGSSGSGHCRRYPPKPLVVGIETKKSPIQPNKITQIPRVEGFYAPTTKNHDCGEWKPKLQS